ncbi:unnamed protein product [Danaus chrysippus]|uniref:(African queen) hypothetical protein n=1 Tax=Danaus chrysippus TaxID=151541 RepID=A0A8J2Q4W7_9NEOP|nr:unnamed protein product [Danaus chrysippus]
MNEMNSEIKERLSLANIKWGCSSLNFGLDNREGVTSHWSDPTTLGSRATFRTSTTPAVLLLTKLRLDNREGVTSHWSDPTTLGSRATFRTSTTPAVLLLTKLR